jgi:hypothetical protein
MDDKTTYEPDRAQGKLSCEAKQVLASVPDALTELNAWYSGYYMAEVAPLDGRLHRTLDVIASTYGTAKVIVPDQLYRVDKGDLPEGVTTAKPITSWSRSHAGARSFYDIFTNGVNRLGSSQYAWRIIRASNPRPIATFEATLRFLKDTNKELYEWLAVPDMLKSEEVICLTPDKLDRFAVVEPLPRLPLGTHEETKLHVQWLMEKLGFEVGPPPALGA